MNTKAQITMTIEEAKKEGYTGFVYNNDGFQSISQLDSDVDDIDWTRDDIFLVEKESKNPAGMSSTEIAELLAEHIECNHSDETGDDRADVYEVIKKLDFTEVENKIKVALSDIHYYTATKIKLVQYKIA